MIKKVHHIVPFTALQKLLLLLSILMQLAVITYSHSTGYYAITDVPDLFKRLAWGISLTFIASNFLAYPNIYIINLLNQKLNWNQHVLSRLFLELGYGMCWAALVGLSITIVANVFNPYAEPLLEVLVNNALIFATANIMLIGVLEAWLFYNESVTRKKESERLEAEMMKVQFNLLKKQLNPHFMFNSLNVLTGLIAEDPKKAQEFTTEFSYIYRYVLSAIEQSVVKLKEEINFAQSYFFLQQIRYGPHLQMNVDIPAHYLNLYLPPLALQVVIENAIKHNLISKDNPLVITITCDLNCVVIKNKLKPKMDVNQSSGLGQKNLTQQYQMVHTREPHFSIENDEYVVYLPLLMDEDEGSHY